MLFDSEFWHNYRLYVFVLENLGIVTGYVFLGLCVVPRVAIHLRRTRWGGIGFFLTCGMTHGDQAIHSMLEPHEQYGNISAEWHMLAIHGFQLLFVAMFVSGLYLEFVHWGPWALGQSEDWTPWPVGHARRERRRRERRRREEPVTHDRRLGERRH